MKSTNKKTFFISSIIILGAFLFSSKGVLTKLMYEEGLTAGAILAIRMATALPFYLISSLMMRHSLSKVSAKDWSLMFVLALIGYCFCSWINTMGLRYISVGLERVILFCYPTIVLISSSLINRSLPSMTLVFACILSWLGLYFVIWDEIEMADEAPVILLGGGLVFLSAVIYACYILIAKPIIVRVGSQQYTSLTMMMSCLLVIILHATTIDSIVDINYSQRAITYGVIIGILCTVLPTYILSYGLANSTPSSYAILSSVGPVLTILVSLIIAGQQPGIIQSLGICCSIAGCLLESRGDDH